MAVKTYTVSELTKQIDELLQGSFYGIWVEGEVSNVRPSSSGHLYFLLIDEHAALKCIIYKSRINWFKVKPKNGLKLKVFGHISVYLKGGEYSLVVEAIKEAGEGKKFYDLEKLKKEFKALGYFDRKRPIPEIPKRILLFSSITGAAVRDIINIIQRRSKGVEILIYPITVQGNLAKNSILNALKQANFIEEEIDVAVLARGGGSEEDLWIFNDPDIAKALFNLKFPTISAIGHQIDTTLCDFVADKRAETPSAAAEMLTEKRLELIERINRIRDYITILTQKLLNLKGQKLKNFSTQRNAMRLKGLLENKIIHLDRLTDNINSSIKRLIMQKERKVEQLKNRINLLSPQEKLRVSKEHLKHFNTSINRSIQLIIKNKQQLLKPYHQEIENRFKLTIKNKRQRIEILTSKIENLSPLSILKKGYSITFDESGKPIRSISQIKEGDLITTRFGEGEATSLVKSIKN
ncbi:exodeoxyribonuclease VII large subunit [Hippea alviniae]|uniref:exodeoxyribonuclease VII large subunit n=1 Tax=Hippea alviniae TaxID=1279027 RepID=UPI0003B668C3|nr:exodeoxyribonuclease VII large subunit [Hippea alviniae]